MRNGQVHAGGGAVEIGVVIGREMPPENVPYLAERTF